MSESEIGGRLRRTARLLQTTPAHSDVLLPLLQAAADEADRFYTGMLAWKALAEAKDAAQLAAPASDDAKDAARYRWLRNASLNDERELDVCDDAMNVFFGEDLDMAIDDAIDHAAIKDAAPQGEGK